MPTHAAPRAGSPYGLLRTPPPPRASLKRKIASALGGSDGRSSSPIFVCVIQFFLHGALEHTREREIQTRELYRDRTKKQEEEACFIMKRSVRLLDKHGRDAARIVRKKSRSIVKAPPPPLPLSCRSSFFAWLFLLV